MSFIKNYIVPIIILVSMAGCRKEVISQQFMIPSPTPLEMIERRGVINVCASYNTTDYYVWQGIAKGFHYELIKDFTSWLGVLLNMDTSTNMEQALDGVKTGKYELAAMSIATDELRDTQLLFSDPLFYTHRVLIQNSERKDMIRHLQQLNGEEIFVEDGGDGKHFLEHLRDSLKINFKITTLKCDSYEDILLMVERGEIGLTVVMENVAETAAKYMPHIDYSLRLSEKFPVSWAVPNGATQLLEEINRWISEKIREERLAVTYNRYFKNNYITTLHNSKYYKLKNGIISDFDPLIKREAKGLNWDWRLLAALIYHESGFNPEAYSYRGAIGLMQVMPETALDMGYESYYEPEENIGAGISYLRQLEKIFDKYPIKPEEKLKFVLAAYNAGPGHVIDAMNLAESYEKDPFIWQNNVDFFLLNKSKPEFYRDPISKHGYCNGEQPYNYVNNIVETYTHYKNTIPN